MRPEVYAMVRKLAAKNKRTLSSMCAEIIQKGISHQEYQDQLNENESTDTESDSRQATPQAQYKAAVEAAALSGVDLNIEKLKKIQMILDSLD